MMCSPQMFLRALAVSLLVILGLGLASTTPITKENKGAYSTKYDNFDVQGVLSSNRLLKRYTDCLLDKGPCPPEGKYLKDVIPDAINTACSKCNPVQKKQAGLIMQHLLLHKKDTFKEVLDKFDIKDKASLYEIDVDGIDYTDLEEA